MAGFDRVEAYKRLYYIRAVEEELARRYPLGQMRQPVHFSIGQEGVAVGVTMAMLPGTHYYGGHRNHHWYLACGGDLIRMLKELHGLPGGCWDGKAGSMHLADEAAGYMGSFPIVGDAISIATGSALAAKLQGSDRWTVVAFGDAGLESGQFWESANFAALHKLKLLYVCEDNGYATQTPQFQRQPNDHLALRASAFLWARSAWDRPEDIVGILRDKAEWLPVFLHVRTYRFLEHVGPNDDRGVGYRTAAEIDYYRGRDALVALRETIEQEKATDIEEAVRLNIVKAFQEVDRCLAPTLMP